MKKGGFIIGIILLVLTLMMPLSDNPPAQAAEGPQAAPLSPAFIRFQQNHSEPFYGYIPPTMDLSHLSRISVKKGITPLNSLPGTFDLRETGKVTSVKDQGSCGTCWLFGTLAAVESRCLVVENVTYDFSEQNIVCCADPAWTYLVGNRCHPGGNSFISSDTLTKKGTRLESCQPYNTSSIDSESCYDNCTSIKRLNGFRLVASNATMTDETKQAIYDYGAVSMAFYYNGAHYNSTTKIYYYPNCTTDPNHMVCIAGWNDSVTWPDKSGSGVWIVKNSWGTGWGDSGYFYLCYGSGNMQEVGSYRYEDYPLNKTIYLYYWDEVGYISSAGYGDNSAWMASMFNATYEGNLTAVEFWMPSNNASYHAYVYRDGNISNGLQNLTAEGNGTCDELGYYSVTLNTTVSLSSSEPFTIAVNITTPGYDYPIPIEMAVTGICNPPIQGNATFISHTGASWTDTAPSGWNVCLRGKVESPPAIIEGTTYQANATLLPQANITLKLGGVEKGNVTSNATGYYNFTVTRTGNYTINVTKGSFTYQEKWANVTAPNQTITCDFKGMDAPYPTAPNGLYCLKCSNLWLYGASYPEGFALNATRVSDVLYAWTHPS